ncbi:hypothetical protein LOK49_LG01G04210 [Camellia lanceoleosa]|uniref:Uncharacterized protein n=1 Tax=Camellia lanceoleosa TaxID=1840588 RepID=A0ACC0IWC3_9ERIC|nr:hypothetical protein LOK49_LG01G04210 [Camellia lanceoleosa]
MVKMAVCVVKMGVLLGVSMVSMMWVWCHVCVYVKLPSVLMVMLPSSSLQAEREKKEISACVVSLFFPPQNRVSQSLVYGLLPCVHVSPTESVRVWSPPWVCVSPPFPSLSTHVSVCM